MGTRGSAGRATRQHEQSKAVLKPVVKWESGWAAVGSRGGSSRGGGGGISKVQCVQVQVQVVDGRGWCSGSTCLGRDWTGLGLETAELPGDHGQQGGTGHKIWGGDPLMARLEGDAVQLRNVGGSKKGDEMGQAKSKADGRTSDDRPIEYPTVGAGENWAGLLWLEASSGSWGWSD